MRYFLLILAVVALVGCGEKEDGNTGVVIPKSPSPKVTPEQLIINPIVEKAIRLALNKPESELTEAEFGC